MAVSFKPQGYGTVTPYLVVERPDEFLKFLEKGLGAKVTGRFDMPDGGMHAEVLLGESKIMVGGAMGAERKPQNAMLYVYVPDADAVYKQALAAGATGKHEPKDMFYGDRAGGFADAFGNNWWVATHKEDIAPEEMQQRALKSKPDMQKQGAGAG